MTPKWSVVKIMPHLHHVNKALVAFWAKLCQTSSLNFLFNAFLPNHHSYPMAYLDSESGIETGQTSQPTAFYLPPELWDRIQELLALKDLKLMQLVSRAWTVAGARLLF
jgi:hypothetical protein